MELVTNWGSMTARPGWQCCNLKNITGSEEKVTMTVTIEATVFKIPFDSLCCRIWFIICWTWMYAHLIRRKLGIIYKVLERKSRKMLLKSPGIGILSTDRIVLMTREYILQICKCTFVIPESFYTLNWFGSAIFFYWYQINLSWLIDIFSNFT